VIVSREAFRRVNRTRYRTLLRVGNRVFSCNAGPNRFQTTLVRRRDVHTPSLHVIEDLERRTPMDPQRLLIAFVPGKLSELVVAHRQAALPAGAAAVSGSQAFGDLEALLVGRPCRSVIAKCDERPTDLR